MTLQEKVKLLQSHFQATVDLPKDANDNYLLMIGHEVIATFANQEAAEPIIDILIAVVEAENDFLADEEFRDDEPRIEEPDYPDYGPPGSGAVITEYEVGTYDEPW